MIVFSALGGALGCTVFGFLWLAVPRQVSPLVRLARFDATVTAHTTSTSTSANASAVHGWAQRAGGVLAAWLTRRGITYPTLRQDVALTGRTFEALLVAKVLASVTGFIAALVATAGLRVGTGAPLTPPVALALAVASAAVLFVVPDVETRREAGRRRRQFRRALSGFLELVALQMAGSAAPAEALPSAAAIGSGWSIELISDCLYRATVSGVEHWEALGELGTRIGVKELTDLGALVQLVQQDGARVRDTLIARAATMRRDRLADISARAAQRDQSMLIAQVVLGLGFMVFLGFAALAHVMLS